jgi:aspartyl-tRNA(Asn)/glutamyl-tRNA(Gln) amidotransferase subunit A
MSDLTKLTAVQIAEGVRAKKLKAVDVTTACLERIEKLDGKVKAFLHVLKESALAQAEAIDAKAAAGEKLGPLAGVPIALKDNMMTAGAPTTCGSKILENHVAVYDAGVVERLKKADAIIIGKTNLDEFAMGSSTENSGFFTSCNPWDLQRVPGGSSGGSTAAVASRMVPVALGSDTGGSIRQPAALCGTVGLKPTYGAVSRYGLVAFASSLDQIGPLTRTVEDAALTLGVIAGHDERDSTSAPQAGGDYLKDLKGGVSGLKIGVPNEYFAEGLDPAVEKSVRAAISSFKDMGAEIVEVSLPHTKYALSAYYIIAPSEASANLSRFDGIRYGLSKRTKGGSLTELYEASRGAGFGAEVKRRIMLGTYALSSGYYDAYYSKAQKVRTLIRGDFKKAFEQVDLLITPTAPTTAFKPGEKSDPLQMYLADIFTLACNIAGHGGVSIPCGTVEGLPVGLQLMCPPNGEALMLRAAQAFEGAHPFAECPETA